MNWIRGTVDMDTESYKCAACLNNVLINGYFTQDMKYHRATTINSYFKKANGRLMKNRKWLNSIGNKRKYTDEFLKDIAAKMGIKSKSYQILQNAYVWYMMKGVEFEKLGGKLEAIAWQYEIGNSSYLAFDILDECGDTCNFTFQLVEKKYDFSSDSPVVPLKSATKIITLFAREFKISVEWKRDE